MVSTVLIGLGKQNTKDHLMAALGNENTKVVAVCDVNLNIVKEVSKKLNVPGYTNLKEMIVKHKPKAAVVAVPHKYYSQIVTLLINQGVHVFKEKPLDINLKQAIKISQLADKSNITLSVAVQRKHSKIYKLYSEYRKQIGDIFSVHGEYTLNISDLSEGWRSSQDMAGGGTVIDMGYHLIDLITWYFGVPERISAELGYHNKVEQNYDVEDTAKIQFSYMIDNRRILGSIILSRIYPEKDEALSIYGTKGAIKIFKNRIELYDNNRELVESTFVKTNGDDIQHQFDDFISEVQSKGKGNHKEHLKNMVCIDAIYRSDRTNKTILPFEEKRYKNVLNDKV